MILKKSKLIVLAAALLCLCMVFGACGSVKATKPSKVLTDTYHDDSARILSSATSVDLKQLASISSSYQFAYDKDTTGDYPVLIVYNMESNTTVYTSTDTDTTTSVVQSTYRTDYYDLGLFVIRTDTVTDGVTRCEYTLYDEAGTKIASTDGKSGGYTSVWLSMDLFLFNDVVYRVAADKTYAEACRLSDLNMETMLDVMYGLYEMTENYYYIIGSGEFYVYDKSLNLVAHERLPEYAASSQIFILDDGVLLMQYTIAQPDDAEDYDLYSAGQKLELVTELYTVKNQKTKTVKSDYYFTSVSANATDMEKDTFGNALSDDVVALAMAYEIKDKRQDVDYADITSMFTSTKYLLLDAKGNVKSSLSDAFEDMVCIESIAPGYYAYLQSDLRTAILIDKDGNVIGNISDLGVFDEMLDDIFGTHESDGIPYNQKYLISDRKLYNFDLTVAYDFAAADMVIEQIADEAVYFSNDDGDIFIYNGTLTKLKDADDDNVDVALRYSYYIVKTYAEDGSWTAAYYSENGTLLLTTDVELQNVASHQGIRMFRGTNSEGKKVWYRFA